MKLYEIVSLKLDDKLIEANKSYSISEKDLYKNSIRIRESELIRILLKLDGSIDNTVKYPFITSLIVLNIKKHVGYWHDELLEFELNGIKYVRLMTGSGFVRNSKCFYIRKDLFQKVNEILLCGMNADMEFNVMSKYNSYYALPASDSIPVTMPRICVIPDYQNTIHEHFDVVRITNTVKEINHRDGTKDVKSKDEYELQNSKEMDYKINAFDGAGLVSLEMAEQWKNDVGFDYFPASFQFRAIPGIKGNLYPFPIYKFAEEHHVTKIVDIWNKEWDIKDIDVILTESQFKFIKQFPNGLDQWVDAFNTELYGYRRAWNISEYAPSPDELKHKVLTAYQHLQTLSDLSDDEIRHLSQPTLDIIRKVSLDTDEFLKYRGIADDEDNAEDAVCMPPFYKALKINHGLAYDSYIRRKMDKDIATLKRHASIGKLFVDGNYQTLTVDVYALAQWAFKLPVTGLLKAGQVYCKYWDAKAVEKVVIERNPHVAEESVIGNVVDSKQMDEWYRWQNTGIIFSIWDSNLMHLGGADSDGDHVFSSNNPILIAAAKRNKANTIIPMDERTKLNNNVKPKKISDVKALMEADRVGMLADIGSVINRCTQLWAYSNQKGVQDFIKIMSVIGGLTIDQAKHGMSVKMPTEIKQFLKDKNKPYFFQFTDNANPKEEFTCTNSVTDRLCKYVQHEIEKIEKEVKEKVYKSEFEMHQLLNKSIDTSIENTEMYKQLKEKLIFLQNEHDKMNGDYYREHQKRNFTTKYDIFYEYAQQEFLSVCNNADLIVSYLVYMSYCDYDIVMHHDDKSILWNCFANELLNIVEKANGKEPTYRQKRLVAKQKRLDNLKKKTKEKKAKSRVVRIKMLEGKVAVIYKSEIQAIRKFAPKDFEKQRLLYVLYVTFKMNDNPFQISGSVKNKINPTQICKLVDITKYKYDKLMSELISDGLVCKNDKMYSVNIHVESAENEIECIINNINQVKYELKTIFKKR